SSRAGGTWVSHTWYRSQGIPRVSWTMPPTARGEPSSKVPGSVSRVIEAAEDPRCPTSPEGIDHGADAYSSLALQLYAARRVQHRRRGSLAAIDRGVLGPGPSDRLAVGLGPGGAEGAGRKAVLGQAVLRALGAVGAGVEVAHDQREQAHPDMHQRFGRQQPPHRSKWPDDNT